MAIKKGYKNFLSKEWGYELLVDKEEFESPTVHKIIVVLARQETDYHYHKKRHQTWEIIHGEAYVSVDDTTYIKVYPGTIWKFAPGVKHNVKALIPLVIDEVSTNYVENDVFKSRK